jgi:hypothetical protein
VQILKKKKNLRRHLKKMEKVEKQNTKSKMQVSCKILHSGCCNLG